MEDDRDLSFAPGGNGGWPLRWGDRLFPPIEAQGTNAASRRVDTGDPHSQTAMKTVRHRAEVRVPGEVGPRTIGFRLDDAHRRLLCQQADRVGMTPHAFARYVLICALHQPERLSAIEEAILQAAAQIQALRSSVAFATEGLMIAAGGMSSQDAKVWVRQYLKPE